jgi:putative FmdB family regulatory protein
MPTYEYTCPVCGGFEVWRPAAHAGEPVACPDCGAPSARRFGPPNLRLTPAPLGAAIERSERSAYEPEVVTSPPRGGVPLHGGHAHRPRRPWQLG